MGWLVGFSIYLLVLFSIIAWEYRGNIQRYIYKPETRPKKGKTESGKEYIRIGGKEYATRYK